MSQEWLNIQSFFSDQELLGAINDLSIAVKQKAAGVHDLERQDRAKEARKLLKKFLGKLSGFESTGGIEHLLGVDSRFQKLTESIASAKQSNKYHSVLMKDGAQYALPLLEAKSEEAKVSLLDSLAELRSIIEQHQQVDASAIFEDI